MKSRRKIDVFARAHVIAQDGPPIAVVPSAHLKKFRQHKHEFDELVIVTSGQAMHIRNNEARRVTKGDVFFVPENQPHSYESANKFNIINVIYDHTLLDVGFNDLRSLPGYHAIFLLEPEYFGHLDSGRLHLNPSELEWALTLIRKIETELSARNPGYLLATMSSLFQLLVYLSRTYTNTHTSGAQQVYRMGTVLSFLEENFAEKMSVPALAKIAHLSPRQFHRVFCQVTGVTPHQYQLQLQLKYARKLLRNSDLNIGTISEKCGFDDGCYFSKVFRKNVGASPRAYRSLDSHNA